MNLELRLANYITRYAPSRSKLLEYISRKSYQGDMEGLLSTIRYDENMMMQMWIRTYIVQGIGERDITIKLMKKRFPKEKIYAMLASSQDDIRDWESHSNTITARIHHDLARGKSKRIIGMMLIAKYPYFQEEIESILAENDDKSGFESEIRKLLSRYNIREIKEKKKLYDALLRRGFSYEQISKYLKNYQNT